MVAQQESRTSGDAGAPPEPEESALAADLRYTSDAQPGIRRRRRGRHFTYLGPDGAPVHDERTLARIRSLAIPPAWTDVWICPSPRGHLQATGRDAKGRKQYRYHPRWRAVRDETKYEHTIAFAEALPRIRARVADDLARPGLPREKVLATVVRLLDTTHIRVGNDEYARQNRSFGLTTLHNRHVEISGGKLHFAFRGKSGKKHAITVHDRALARIVRRLRDLPGYELFQYLDEHGQRQGIDSADVNAYLREISGCGFTAKDFRTWAGTVAAVRALCAAGAFHSESEANHKLVQAIKTVAEQLGNTPAVCRSCYIHPAAIDAYLGGRLAAALRRNSRHEQEREPAGCDEAAVLALLRSEAARRAEHGQQRT
ncbi:MAG TPA: DNA topoisomerase IB [Dehalococcoidia bacterium]